MDHATFILQSELIPEMDTVKEEITLEFKKMALIQKRRA